MCYKSIYPDSYFLDTEEVQVYAFGKQYTRESWDTWEIITSPTSSNVYPQSTLDAEVSRRLKSESHALKLQATAQGRLNSSTLRRRSYRGMAVLRFCVHMKLPLLLKRGATVCWASSILFKVTIWAASTLVWVNRFPVSLRLSKWLDGSSEEKNVGLVNGEVQETSQWVSDIGTKACADNAVPRRPICCIEILRITKKMEIKNQSSDIMNSENRGTQPWT